MARRYDAQGRDLDIDAEKTDMSASAVDEKMRKTRLGDAAKSAGGAPKQRPDEDAAAFGARYRKYREGMTAKDQANALDKRR